MRLYNTLGREVKEFVPQKTGEASLYTCGPTVYSYYHVGNLRNAVFNDTLRRVLESAGINVKQVMNITDVGHLTSNEDEGEDKLEKGAAKEQKSVWEVADFYINAFLQDMKALNILPPNGYKDNNYARATDFIDQQLEIIKLLINKGFAYKTGQAIYFDVTKLDDYGKLTGQRLAEKETGARREVVVDQDKHHPQDFALWFFKVGRFADHSMSWPSPWGDGFPGWHLECSAIIHATLGEPLDIHTGGVDHIGTHHTNEIAQTEAAFDTELAKYWVHNEHLLADGQKMAKSSGNFYTLKDVIDKGYDPLALRLLFLQAHYRSRMNFTWEAMEAAQQFLNRLQAWADLKFQPNATDKGTNYDDSIDKIKQALQNDLNSAEALATLSNLVVRAEEDGIDIQAFQTLLEQLDSLLGLKLDDRQDVNEEVKQLLNNRQKARDDSDWTRSDQLRDELAKLQVEVQDTARGQLWRRVR
ncbi:cysteine--tRNA ligase [Candidatus Saccharibacteria bacterium]|nr:cysteine--tRNA ligase [Candidatus Saccharibacteria bacterium]